MDFDDLLQRYFGTSDLAEASPAVQAANSGVEGAAARIIVASLQQSGEIESLSPARIAIRLALYCVALHHGPGSYRL